MEHQALLLINFIIVQFKYVLYVCTSTYLVKLFSSAVEKSDPKDYKCITLYNRSVWFIHFFFSI